MANVCLLCLDPVPSLTALNRVQCACELTVHDACLQKWYETKSQIECPICHKVSVPLEPTVVTVVTVFPVEVSNNRSNNKVRDVGIGCLSIVVLIIIIWGAVEYG